MRNGLERAIYILAACFGTAHSLAGISFAEQPKVKPVGRVVVADSKGKVVGESIGGLGVNVSETFGPSDVRPTVLIQVDQHVGAVHVARDRVYGGRLWFDSENCLGTPWFPVEPLGGAPLPILAQSAIGPPGQTLYVQAPGGATQSVAIKSMFSSGAQCTNVSQSFNAVLAIPLIDLLTVFTPPFSLRAAP